MSGPDPFQVLASGPQGDHWRLHLRIPVGTPLCEGHFPGHPIVPGVAHLAWVEKALADRGGRSNVIQGIRGVRFRKPVHPGDELELQLLPAREGSFAFHLKRAGEAVSDGRVEVAGADPRAEADVASGTDPGRSRAVEDLPDCTIPSLPGDSVRSYPAAESLIPHRGPMRLLRRVLDNGAETILGEAEIPPENPLAAGAHAPGWLALEASAQAAAALEALSRRDTDPGARFGYLVGVREARITLPMLPTGVPFQVTLRPQGSVPPLAIYEAVASLHGAPLLAATLSTYVPG
jgi:3-hydroxymyristoyl/3-hydroxydecanoyl-(acyl carrier protein) dehydratase